MRDRKPMRPKSNRGRATVLASAVAAVLILPVAANAQESTPGRFAAAEIDAYGFTSDPWLARGHDHGHLASVLAGALGGFLGFYAGAVTGWKLYELSGASCACEDPGLGAVVAGALIGIGVGAATGVHLGNARRGEWLPGALAGAGTTLALGWLGLTARAAPLVLAAPVAGLAAAAVIEFSTEREHP